MSAVKRKVGPLALALSLAVVLLALPAAAAWDAGGRWLIEGTGYGEKSPVRLRLALNGYMDVRTATSGDVRFITGYDLNMRLDTSRAGVKTWTEEIHETLHVPVPLPSLAPTVNEPFRLPDVRADGLTYAVTLTSATSGTVDIYGTIDLDVLGRTPRAPSGRRAPGGRTWTTISTAAAARGRRSSPWRFWRRSPASSAGGGRSASGAHVRLRPKAAGTCAPYFFGVFRPFRVQLSRYGLNIIVMSASSSSSSHCRGG